MPSLGNIDFNGSTAGQNLNSNSFLTARCLMLQTSFNSQGIIFNAKQTAKFQNSKMVDEGLSGSLDWHEQSCFM